MGFERDIATLGFIRAIHPPLTGGCGFDQCPAPFAGPDESQTLQIAPATPDKPLLTPYLGSVS